MTNTEKKIFAVIMDYDNFKKLSPEKRKTLLKEKNIEWRVYIPCENMDLLTEAEKENLSGFKITHVPPVKIKIFDKKDLFPKETPIETPILIDRKKQEKIEKKEERKRFKRSIPLKLGVINTKKKGGR